MAECELCRLILSQVELVISQFKDVENGNAFRELNRSGHPTFDFFLMKRRVEGDGFFVLCNGTSGRGFYLVAAIGLCTKDGAWSPNSSPMSSSSI